MRRTKCLQSTVALTSRSNGWKYVNSIQKEFESCNVQTQSEMLFNTFDFDSKPSWGYNGSVPLPPRYPNEGLHLWISNRVSWILAAVMPGWSLNISALLSLNNYHSHSIPCSVPLRIEDCGSSFAIWVISDMQAYHDSVYSSIRWRMTSYWQRTSGLMASKKIEGRLCASLFIRPCSHLLIMVSFHVPLLLVGDTSHSKTVQFILPIPIEGIVKWLIVLAYEPNCPGQQYACLLVEQAIIALMWTLFKFSNESVLRGRSGWK